MRKITENSLQVADPHHHEPAGVSLTIKEENYVAEVKEKEEAKTTYEEASVQVWSVRTGKTPTPSVSTPTWGEGRLHSHLLSAGEYILHVDPGVVLDDFPKFWCLPCCGVIIQCHKASFN